MLVDFLHVSLMTLSTLRFGRLTLQHFRKNALLHYSDWPHVQALARRITEVIVIALKVRCSPKTLDGEDVVFGHGDNTLSGEW
jgi:hypothetical protein